MVLGVLIALSIWLALCCWSDVRWRRIPNAFTVAGLAAGLLFQITLSPGQGLIHPTNPGADGLVRGLIASAGMLAAGLLLWKLRFFGAGDAKMLTAIAAWVGPSGALPVLLLTLCAGGMLAIGSLMLRKIRARTPHVAAVPLGQAAVSLPYSLAIMVGTLGYVVVVRSGLWGQ